MDERAGVYPVHRTFFKELVLRLQGLGLGELTPIDRGRVASPLLWEVAQAQGRSIGVVDGYFYSYPAPPLSRRESWYVAYGADGFWQAARERDQPPAPQAAARYATPPVLLDELGELLARADFEWQSAALLRLLARRGQPDQVSLYTHEPDTLQHASWRYHEPHRYFGIDERTAPHRDRVAAFYLALDRFLGELRARLSPETVLVLVSDHGHSPTMVHEMDTQHRHGPPGMLLLHGPGIAAGELAGAGVLEVYPTLLQLLGLPVPRDADGAVLDAALTPTYRSAHPLRTVASWDGLPRPAPAAPADAARSREELEKLRNLGYIR
jgi:arylsulfatase A-like enzyme